MTDRRALLTGWKKDRYDHRDFEFHRGRRAPVYPDRHTLINWMPTVRDQGMIGSCVGFGIGANLTALANRFKVDPEWFSPTWIYNGARFIEGTLNYDEGCEPRNALKWIADRGSLKEHYWPYDPARLDRTSPPSKFDGPAREWPIVVYTRITNGIDGICAAIAAGYPVSIGNPWYDVWMDTDHAGNLMPITSQYTPNGGHETIIYGYDKPAGVFLCQNSWGVGWGDAGRFRMPMSALAVFNEHGGYDAHTIDVEWKPEPQSASVGPEPQSGSVDPIPVPEPRPVWPWIVGFVVLMGIIIAVIAL